jgi:cysteine-rich repeat protein
LHAVIKLVALLVVCVACGPAPRSAKAKFDTEIEPSCPIVTGLSALPLEAVVGGVLEVSAEMTAGTSEMSWTATAGHFDDPEVDRTRYHCDVGGRHVLTFTLGDGETCEDSVDLDVTCSYSPLCGNGRIDPGEQCDDGNTEQEDGCSVRCFREPLELEQ